MAGPTIVGALLGGLIWLALPQNHHLVLGIFAGKPEQNAEPNLNSSGPVSYAEAVNRAAPSVVNIYTLREQTVPSSRHNPLLGGTERTVTPGTGSGVIISEDGYIITNLHVISLAQDVRVSLQDGREAFPTNLQVIRFADDIRVALQDGREATPKIVGFSKEDDMALLKVDIDNLQPIAVGNPDEASVGDVVLAIGNPFGVGQSVTQGIISATRRKGLNIADHENFLQTDAAINPGNSGGALVDAYGRLLGINIGDLRGSAAEDANGIGFAIPVDRAMQAMQDILEYGRVVRGWLGVSPLDLNERIAKKLNLSTTDGVLVMDIYKNGPADIAGLLPGDIIQAINNNPTPNMYSAQQEFATLRPGDLITLDIIRAGELKKLQAVLSISPAA